MKTWKLRLATLLAIASFAGSAGAATLTINDNYIGADYHGWSNGKNDAISDPADEFDITSMNVTFNGNNKLSQVAINTTYMPNRGAFGTDLGDLFIKTSKYNTPANSNTDNFYNPANYWNYALVLEGDRRSSTGSLALYEINTDISKRNDFFLAEDKIPSGYIFRNGQLVEVRNKDLSHHVNFGTWTADNNNNRLIFDIAQNNILTGSDFGFHWGMTCANDIIEGGASAPVPEPSTFVLLGAGLLSSGFIRRRMKK